jgi:hypothetical protein
MSRVISCMIVLLFSLSLVVPSAMAQVEMFSQTIRGDLLSIKGTCMSSKISSGGLCISALTTIQARAHVGSGGENRGRCDYRRESRRTSTGEVSP